MKLTSLACRLGATALLAALALVASPAPAQQSSESTALAVQLFDEAEALFSKGQVAQACPKYEESYRLDPQLGVLLYLAECYEKNRQVASAWGRFREAEELARKRGDTRADQAAQRAVALEPRLSYLVVQVQQDARLPGLQVSRNSVAVAPVLWGSRAAVDTGTYVVEASAPGYLPWRREVVIAQEANSVSVDVPKLKPDPKAKAGPVTGNGRGDDPGTSRRIAAIAVGGLGIAAVGVGGFLGLSAQSSLSDAKPLCNEKDYCTVKGDELRTSAKNKALAATIVTGAGAAALVTATVLWFTAPKLESDTAPKPQSRKQAWTLTPARDAWGVEVSHAF